MTRGAGRTRLVPKLLLLLTTLALSVLVVEMVFRLTRPQRAFQAASELEAFRLNPEDLTRYFEIDPRFGFRPVLGSGLYGDAGTRVNDYTLKKPPDTTRLLFLGDSVTARAHIVEAVRDLSETHQILLFTCHPHLLELIQEIVPSAKVYPLQ